MYQDHLSTLLTGAGSNWIKKVINNWVKRRTGILKRGQDISLREITRLWLPLMLDKAFNQQRLGSKLSGRTLTVLACAWLLFLRPSSKRRSNSTSRHTEEAFGTPGLTGTWFWQEGSSTKMDRNTLPNCGNRNSHCLRSRTWRSTCVLKGTSSNQIPKAN